MKKKKAEKPSFLYVKGVPEDLKREFKSTCTRNGTSMKAEIICMMKEYVSTIKISW